jgi:hypothetical protein
VRWLDSALVGCDLSQLGIDSIENNGVKPPKGKSGDRSPHAK